MRACTGRATAAAAAAERGVRQARAVLMCAELARLALSARGEPAPPSSTCCACLSAAALHSRARARRTARRRRCSAASK
jgi:hypothetical protein